jgi:hypothetical protein
MVRVKSLSAAWCAWTSGVVCAFLRGKTPSVVLRDSVTGGYATRHGLVAESAETRGLGRWSGDRVGAAGGWQVDALRRRSRARRATHRAVVCARCRMGARSVGATVAGGDLHRMSALEHTSTCCPAAATAAAAAPGEHDSHAQLEALRVQIGWRARGPAGAACAGHHATKMRQHDAAKRQFEASPHAAAPTFGSRGEDSRGSNRDVATGCRGAARRRPVARLARARRRTVPSFSPVPKVVSHPSLVWYDLRILHRRLQPTCAVALRTARLRDCERRVSGALRGMTADRCVHFCVSDARPDVCMQRRWTLDGLALTQREAPRRH